MESATIKLFGATLEVDYEIEKASFGTYDTPGDNGSIEIFDITHNGESIFELIEEVQYLEEKVCDEIRKQL